MKNIQLICFALLSTLFLGCVSTPDAREDRQTLIERFNDHANSARVNNETKRQVAKLFKHHIDGRAYEMPYLRYLPEAAERGEKMPLLIFLHGAAQRGKDVSKVANNGPPMLIKRGKAMPFIIASPLLPKEEWWGHDQNLILVRALINEVMKTYPVDPKRVYITGLSAGGFGTWLLLARHPDLFAAGVPICGGGYPEEAPSLVNMPIWTFHGELDFVVGIKWSRDMVNAIKKAGGNKIKFTKYPFTGHDAWTRTYNNPEVFEWLLKQRKK